MPKISEEEWHQDRLIWLSYRQILAIAMLINEVQRNAPDGFAINSELLKELKGVKTKLWHEVKDVMHNEEIERADIDPDI